MGLTSWKGSRVLKGAVTHEEAVEKAYGQHDAFEQRRRLEAEARAKQQCLDDLQASGQTLGSDRRRAGRKNAVKKRTRKESNGNPRDPPNA